MEKASHRKGTMIAGTQKGSTEDEWGKVQGLVWSRDGKLEGCQEKRLKCR